MTTGPFHCNNCGADVTAHGNTDVCARCPRRKDSEPQRAPRVDAFGVPICTLQCPLYSHHDVDCLDKAQGRVCYPETAAIVLRVRVAEGG